MRLLACKGMNITMKYDDLDALLARSAPATTPVSAHLDAALNALADEARLAAPLPVRPTRRRLWVGGAATVAAIALTGTAAYGATNFLNSEPWMTLTDEAQSQAVSFEWPITLPDGTQCVNRLTGIALTGDQVEIIASALTEPSRLLALDGGAVRNEFLADYDADSMKQEITDRATWEAWIDSGYGAVASMSAEQGRGGAVDAELSVFPGTAENEIFLYTSMRIVLDGITASGVDAIATLTPETACEVNA